MTGLELLTKEEKVALLAQLQAFRGKTVINDLMQKAAKTTTNVVTNATKRVVGKFSEDMSRKIDELQHRLDWDPNVLKRAVAENYAKLNMLDEVELSELLYNEIKRLANLKKPVSDAVLANAIVHRAAKNLRLDVREYLSAQALEDKVFQLCVEEQVDVLQERLQTMSAEEMDKFEEILQQELYQLSRADQEALRKALKLEKLSAQSLVAFLKTTSGVAIAQLLLGSFGFGAFLFITTTMKAFSLLLGFTLPFAAYTTATSILAFALSAPFLLIIAAITGGLMLRKTDSSIGDEMCKVLIVMGRCKLLAVTD